MHTSTKPATLNSSGVITAAAAAPAQGHCLCIAAPAHNWSTCNPSDLEHFHAHSQPALGSRGAKKKTSKRGTNKPASSSEVQDERFSPEELRHRMSNAISSLRTELACVHTGRASPSMLQRLQISAYGSEIPIEAVGRISALDASTLCVDLFDPTVAGSVASSVQRSNLGLNAHVASESRVIVPVPPLTENRRKAMLKAAKDAAEKARANIRRLRSDAMERIKQAPLSQDDAWREQKLVQAITDEHVAELESTVQEKNSTLERA